MAARIGRIEGIEVESDRQTHPRPEPLRVVRRELTTPDGRKVLVDVPVYPPFRLDSYPVETAAARSPHTRGRARSSEPRLRSRRTAKSGPTERRREQRR